MYNQSDTAESLIVQLGGIIFQINGPLHNKVFDDLTVELMIGCIREVCLVS